MTSSHPAAGQGREGGGAGRAGADTAPRIGIALAGGGPLGAIYEIGALCALSEALEGIDFNRLDVYVGVSAGGFIAAGLANGVTPRQMCRMFIENRDEDGEPSFEPGMLLRPALREYAARALAVPPLVLAASWRYLSHLFSGSFLESFQRLSRAIPAGVFDNAGINAYLERAFAAPGRTNDFRLLRRKLYLVATDLDSGEAVAFGSPGHDHVSIARAVQASAALPGLFPPVRIDGRWYVDGALKKTLHASVALRDGANLVLCVNPLVPFDAELNAARGGTRRSALVERGLPAVLAQTFRAIIHSRLEVGLAKYAAEYPGADVVLFEPNRDDAEMFFTNMFSYASRRRLSEHAYQKTRTELFRRRHQLAPVLARHGIRIRVDVLRERRRSLLPQPALRRRMAAVGVARRLADTLDDLQRWIDAGRSAARRAA